MPGRRPRADAVVSLAACISCLPPHGGRPEGDSRGPLKASKIISQTRIQPGNPGPSLRQKLDSASLRGFLLPDPVLQRRKEQEPGGRGAFADALCRLLNGTAAGTEPCRPTPSPAAEDAFLHLEKMAGSLTKHRGAGCRGSGLGPV